MYLNVYIFFHTCSLIIKRAPCCTMASHRGLSSVCVLNTGRKKGWGKPSRRAQVGGKELLSSVRGSFRLSRLCLCFHQTLFLLTTSSFCSIRCLTHTRWDPLPRPTRTHTRSFSPSQREREETWQINVEISTKLCQSAARGDRRWLPHPSVHLPRCSLHLPISLSRR